MPPKCQSSAQTPVLSVRATPRPNSGRPFPQRSIAVSTNQLFGVTSTDPLTYLGVAVLLLSVALLDCYIPAYRPMRTDPMTALRYE